MSENEEQENNSGQGKVDDLKKQVEDLNLIDFRNEGVGVEEIMTLNIKLREDLTKSFENHVRLLSEVEKFRREGDELRI
jgi:uncharacterized protein YeeX (DUF496 family)